MSKQPDQLDRNMKNWTESSRRGYRRALEKYYEDGSNYSAGGCSSPLILIAVMWLLMGAVAASKAVKK